MSSKSNSSQFYGVEKHGISLKEYSVKRQITRALERLGLCSFEQLWDIQIELTYQLHHGDQQIVSVGPTHEDPTHGVTRVPKIS